MLRMILIFILAIVIITVVTGEENQMPTQFPKSYLPEDFIFEVTEDSSLPNTSVTKENQAKNPVTFNVDDLPRAGDTFNQQKAKNLEVQNTWLESSKDNFTPDIEPAAAPLPQQTEPSFFSPSSVSEEVLSFEDIIPSNFGLVDETNQGYSQTLWYGLTEDKAKDLITQLTAQYTPNTTPFAQQILKYMILTRASAPENSSDTSWLAFRAQQLLTLNQSEEAYELLKRTTPEQRTKDHELAQVWADTQLLAFNTTNTCPSVENFLKTTDNIFWKKKLLLCQLFSNQPQKAELSFKLLTDEEKSNDPEFFTLYEETLFHQKTPKNTINDQNLPHNANIDAILAYLARQNSSESTQNNQLPQQTLALKTIIETTSIPLEIRLKAAENKAFIAPTPENISTLKSLYTSIPFTKLEIKDPITTSKTLTDRQKPRALLYQASQYAPENSLKLTALNELQNNLKQHNLTVLNQKLAQNISITPSLDIAWGAPNIAPYLFPNQINIAQQWSSLLSNTLNLSPELKAFSDQLQLALSLYDNRINSLEHISNPIYIQKVLSGLDALNAQIDSSVFEKASQTNQIISPVTNSIWLKNVSKSLQNKKNGEVLLLVLQPLFSHEISELDPLTISNIVTALNYLNMKEKASEFMLDIIWKLENIPDQEL